MSHASGTAFFVSPTILITAAHIVPDGNRKIRAQHPGSTKAPLDPAQFIKSRSVNSFECTFKASGTPNVDIAILEVRGTFRATHYLKPSDFPLEKDDLIDVVGYPGMYTEIYVTHNHHIPDLDADTVCDIFSLLPKFKLVISCGLVISGGIMPRYRLSTVPGMSGAPVIRHGEAVGTVFSPSCLISRCTRGCEFCN